MLWRLGNQTVNLKKDSKTLYYSILKLKYSPFISKHKKCSVKYASLNNSHYNCHSNYTNRILLQKHMFWLIASNGTHSIDYFASLGIFMRQGRRTQDAEVTKSLVGNALSFYRGVFLAWEYSRHFATSPAVFPQNEWRLRNQGPVVRRPISR